MEKEPEKEIYSTDNEKNPIRVCLVLFIFQLMITLVYKLTTVLPEPDNLCTSPNIPFLATKLREAVWCDFLFV